MRLIRFAIGMSVVAVSVIASALAHVPAELTGIGGQEALTNRFESPISETDRLSDRQCPSSEILGQEAAQFKRGSGSSGFDVTRLVCGVAIDDFG